jgi:V/A-type H+-transporting ATPase subunit F
MAKVAIIGDKDIIWGLKGLGLATFAVSSQEEAVVALKDAASSDYSIILILERWAAGMISLIEELKKKSFPIIVFIPDHRGILNLSKERLKIAVRKAVGSDTLVREG